MRKYAKLAHRNHSFHLYLHLYKLGANCCCNKWFGVFKWNHSIRLTNLDIYHRANLFTLRSATFCHLRIEKVSQAKYLKSRSYEN